MELAKRLGARSKVADEIWGINALGDVVACDRIFHMDDVRIQESRAAAAPKSNIAAMLPWLRRHQGPIYTSRPHEDYPGMIAYPLEDVINACGGFAYFNSTAAYAVAFAIAVQVRQISLFGIDFSYPDMHAAEKGRACVEFWLGLAAARGIDIKVGQHSSLMDANEPPDRRVYGYDTLHVDIAYDASGKARITTRPRAVVPTASEIEARYDHTAHPTTEKVA